MTEFNLKNILNPIKLKQLAQSWINEDVPSFDIQGLIVGDVIVNAEIYCKQPSILAGVPFVDAVFEEIGLTKPKWRQSEGTFLQDASVQNRIPIASVQGPAKLVLLAERTILNVLSRCSGIATQSHRIRTKLNELGWEGKLAGTRKTTPGFRMVEKYGLLVGQSDTHRYDLSSMVMLKDNHLEIAGHQIDYMIRKVRQYAGFSYKIEVECSSYEHAIRAAEAGADVIMLDNINGEQGHQYGQKLKKQYPNLLIEASGGITERNIHEYAKPGYDIISMGCLVQGYPCIDFSMKIVQNN